jgi:methoxymalonate biosynthesis acyl carrier protein
MSEDASIKALLAKTIAERLGVTVPSFDTNLFESGIVDSLAFVNLLLEIENRFDIHVTLENLELENFQSIEAIAAFIARQRMLPKREMASARGTEDAIVIQVGNRLRDH